MPPFGATVRTSCSYPRAPLSLTPTSFLKHKRPLHEIGFFSLRELHVIFIRLLLIDTRFRTIENPPVDLNCSDRRLRFERPINLNLRLQQAKTLMPHEVSERSNAMLRAFPSLRSGALFLRALTAQCHPPCHMAPPSPTLADGSDGLLPPRRLDGAYACRKRLCKAGQGAPPP